MKRHVQAMHLVGYNQRELHLTESVQYNLGTAALLRGGAVERRSAACYTTHLL